MDPLTTDLRPPHDPRSPLPTWTRKEEALWYAGVSKILMTILVQLQVLASAVRGMLVEVVEMLLLLLQTAWRSRTRTRWR